MLKLRLFPQHSGKDAVLWPPKLPLGLQPLGSFGHPLTASFPDSLEKRWSFGPEVAKLYEPPYTIAKNFVKQQMNQSYF